MCQICEYYEETTNRSAKQGSQRISKIKQYLKEHDLTLDEVNLSGKHADFTNLFLKGKDPPVFAIIDTISYNWFVRL